MIWGIVAPCPTDGDGGLLHDPPVARPVRAGVPARTGRAFRQRRVKTATVRAGTENVPELPSYVEPLVTRSAPAACTGCRV